MNIRKIIVDNILIVYSRQTVQDVIILYCPHGASSTDFEMCCIMHKLHCTLSSNHYKMISSP